MNLIAPDVITLVETVTIARVRRDRSFRRFHHKPAPGIDRGRGRRQLDRDTLGERGDERAKTLAAEHIGIALGGFREIHRRDLRQFFAAAKRAEDEFDRGPPVAEIVRQRLRASDIALARGVGDGAVGAYLYGQEILKLAFAGIAPADPHLLARRRRINFDARAAAAALSPD